MKFYIILIIVLIITGCQKKEATEVKESSSNTFFVGTYTDKDSKGIYKYKLNDDGSLEFVGLAAESINPSFLTKSFDNSFLFAVNEIEKNGVGTVQSFLISPDSLLLINQKSSGGAHPCFITANEDGYILVANYTGGNVGLLKHNNNGELIDLLDVQNHTGSSAHWRQKAPHAHSAWFDSKTNKIISVDLGTNDLWFSQLDTVNQKLIFSDQQKLEMKPGAGPRHLTFHPNGKWIYVVNELDYTVTLVKKSDDGEYFADFTISTLPDDYVGENSCADIHISSDGKFLYASNRGHNSIVIYSVNNSDGSLTLIEHESTLGKKPRNFALSPDENYLLVANQDTDNIVSFKRNKNSGLLEYVDQIEAPVPVCILF